MVRWVQVSIGILLLISSSIAFSEQRSPTSVLTWDADNLSPGWVPGGEDVLPVGPTAFAVSDGRIFMADAAHHRILILDESLQPQDSFHVDVIPADVQVNREGSIYVLSNSLDTVHIFNSKGTLEREILLPEGRVRSLVLGPQGKVWWEGRLGHASCVEGKREPGVALPMGVGSLWHGTGRRLSERRGEILLWTWGEAAEVKPPGPRRIISVETESRLGSIRPLGMDRVGHTFVRLETLSDTAPLKVMTEVLAFDGHGDIVGRVKWTEEGIAPASRKVRVEADGTLIRMESRPEGLTLWRFSAKEWMTGGAR
jgi:hypothetical protein